MSCQVAKFYLIMIFFRVYFSSSTASDSTMRGLGAILQNPACLEGSETKGCTMSKNSTRSSTPNHIIQMFSMLQGNPEVQVPTLLMPSISRVFMF